MTEDVLTAAPSAPPASRGHGLVADSLVLVVAGGTTGLLGLAFWAATARLYPVAEVGRASAVISSAVVLCSLANLSLGSVHERFLPLAGHRAPRLVVGGHAVTVGLSLLLSLAFLALGPRERLFSSPVELAAFPLLVAALTVFALQDQVAVGLGRARWTAGKNVGHSVAKLAAVLALAATASGASIVAAWGACAAVAAAMTGVAVRRRLRSRPGATQDPRLPPRREVLAYAAASYGISVVGQLAPLMVPLVVVSRLGAEQNAYFGLTWALVGALAMLLHVVVGPFVTAAASAPERLAALTRRFTGVALGLGIGAGLFLAVVAPFGLGLIGAEYRTAGTPLLQLMALALPLSVVGSLYNGLARVHRRLRLAVTVQVVAAVVVVGGAWLLAVPHGLRGVGAAFLVAEVITATVLLVPLLRWLRATRAPRATRA